MASIEKTRAVVEADETYDGRIIPTIKAEIGRQVKIHQNATVNGSVYGETVTIDGGNIEGSVMASDSIEFDGGTVDGEVGTNSKVVGTGATVYGTVTGERVRLTDSVVYGNVVGTDVILENCAVIGIVTSERELSIDDGICYTFKSYQEAELTDTSVVLPQAIVEGQLELATPVTVTGLGELEMVDKSVPTLDEADLIEVDGSTYLSLSPRILNLEKVKDRLNKLEGSLQQVVTSSSGEEVPPAEEVLELFGAEESQYPDVI